MRLWFILQKYWSANEPVEGNVADHNKCVDQPRVRTDALLSTALCAQAGRLCNTYWVDMLPILWLSGLDLSGNNVSGTLPDGISMLTALTELAIPNNAVSGTLPSNFSALSLLQ